MVKAGSGSKRRRCLALFGGAPAGRFSFSANNDAETLIWPAGKFFSHWFSQPFGTVPNQQVRQEQDGELVVLPDLLILVLNVFAAVRVSTSKSTTSRRATLRPPRARTRTCPPGSAAVRSTAARRST